MALRDSGDMVDCRWPRPVRRPVWILSILWTVISATSQRARS